MPSDDRSVRNEGEDMAVPHITSFCWCMGLEMGSKLIGYVHLLASLCLMAVCSAFAKGAHEYVGTVEDADGLYTTWHAIATTVAVFSVVHVLLAAMLLYAVYKRKTCVVRVWVWVMIVLLGSSLLYVVVAAASGLSATGSDIFLAFLEGVLFFGMLTYCILCVHSYYLLLRSSEDMEGPNKHDY